MSLHSKIQNLFTEANCQGAVYAKSLTSGVIFDLNGESLQTPASIYKAPLVLALFHLADKGEIDLSKRFSVIGGQIPMQACGLSQFKHPVDIALEDLAYLCLGLSDAESTDIILAEIGLQRFNNFILEWGMKDTFISGGVKSIVEDLAISLRFKKWAHLVEATTGQHGELMKSVALAETTDFYQSTIFNPSLHSKTSGIDFALFLEKLYQQKIADPTSCQKVLALMGKQVSKARVAFGFNDTTSVYAKSGSLFRYIRNEVAIVKVSESDVFALAIFTRANNRETDGKTIDACIGKVASNISLSLCGNEN